MAFSGTISQTVFDTRRVIDRAFGRTRVKAEMISAEYLDIAKDQLYLLLSDLANQGAPLWCIQKQVYPLYEGVGDLTLDVGTVDVLNANLRMLQEVTGANTDSATERVIDFTDDTEVSTVGIKWSAAAVPISLSRSDDNVTWTVIQAETPDAASGEWTWYDLDSIVAARYFRVLATSGTLSFSAIFTGNTPNEVPLYRMNRDMYTTLPNKAFDSDRPLQYWFDRQIPQPIMRLWPLPNSAAEEMQIVVWRQRQIMDVGTLTQEIEVPQRWLQAVVSMLAVRLCYEIDIADLNLLNVLEPKAKEDLYTAQLEETDDSPFMLAPNISAYTK